MARTNLRVNVGRQNVTRALDPAHAGYVKDMRDQMNAIKKNLIKVIDAIEANSVPALRYALRPIYDESQRLVPKDTGALKNSGFLEVRRVKKGVISAAIGYGRGGDPYYAAIVHERVDLNHQAPTQAKYLEEAVNRHIDSIQSRYVGYVQSHTGLSR